MTRHGCPRVLVVALGEATLDLIVPWANEGKLPTFKRLMQEGSWGPLASEIPLITPQLWGTIVTGHGAGRHGAFDFLQRGPDGRFREINGSWLKEPPIWRLLSDRGLRCGIVNVPFTYPPQRISGFMVSGQDAPGAHRSIAQPPSLYDELVRRFRRYRLKDIFPGGRRKEAYLTLIEEDVRKQTDVLEHLLSAKPWDFFMTFFSATAMAQHYFWGDMEARDAANPFRGIVEATYCSLDAALARLLRAAGSEATVFVISECGAGSLRSGVSINAWLAQEGFLTWKKPQGSIQPPTAATNGAAPASRRSALTGLLAWAKQGLPPSIRFLANRHLGVVKTRMEMRQWNARVDWSATRAFSLGKEGDIFISLTGRDPHGLVAPGVEYEAVRSRIIERLQRLVDPQTGRPAVERVYRAEELYDGPLRAWAPDLVVAWRNTEYMPTEDDGDGVTVFVPRQRQYMAWPTTGSHRLDGMLFVAGPGIRRGLLPTWLDLFGQPSPSGIAGRVLHELRDGGRA